MWGSHFLEDVGSNTRPGKHEVQHQTQCGSTGSQEVIFEKIVKIYEYLLTKLIYLFPTAFAAHTWSARGAPLCICNPNFFC